MILKKSNSAYIFISFAVSLLVLVLITYTSDTHPIWEILVLALFATIAESLSVSIGERTISVSSAITLCALLAHGPIAAIWVSLLSILFRVSKSGTTQKPMHIFTMPIKSTLMNASMYILSSAAAAITYVKCGGLIISDMHLGQNPSITQIMTSLSTQAGFILLAIFSEMIVNTLLFAGYLHTSNRGQFLQEWAHDFFWSFAGLLVVGLMGVLITAFYISFNWFVVMIIFSLLFLARYTFSLYNNLRVSYMDTVKSLSDAIEAKDLYTRGHSQRVFEYSALIAEELRYTPRQKEILQYSALLHDVGKIGVTEVILNKPGKLNTEEFDSIKQHPVLGARIISNVKYLKECVPIIKYHHKYYDGSGYPDLTPDEKVPYESYILGVADAYDAMTSKRQYRNPFTQEQALAEIVRCTGTQFEPSVARAFLKAIAKQPVVQEHATDEECDDKSLEAVSQ